jgi:glycolate oxidase iron-sulfur subunit
VKDYGFMFREDEAYAEKAARVSALASDVSEYLAEAESRRSRPSRRPPIYA